MTHHDADGMTFEDLRLRIAALVVLSPDRAARSDVEVARQLQEVAYALWGELSHWQRHRKDNRPEDADSARLIALGLVGDLVIHLDDLSSRLRGDLWAEVATSESSRLRDIQELVQLVHGPVSGPVDRAAITLAHAVANHMDGLVGSLLAYAEVIRGPNNTLALCHARLGGALLMAANLAAHLDGDLAEEVDRSIRTLEAMANAV